MMKFPGWYPSVQYPGKMQWWDGEKFTDKTRYMEPHERYDRSIGTPVATVEPVAEKPTIDLDWLLFLPLTAGLVSLLWVAFAVVPFATGERTISYEKVNATITHVHVKQSPPRASPNGRVRSGHKTCTVYVNAPIGDQFYKATAGNDCSRETGLKTAMTYDPKDIEGTLSNALMPAAQTNVAFALAATVTSFGSAGILTWVRTPLDQRKARKSKKRRKLQPR